MAASVLIAAGLCAVALAAPVISRRLTGDYASPPAIVLGVWGATLGLFLLRLLPYPSLHATSALVILGAVLCLVVASGVAIRWYGRRPAPGPTSLSHAREWVMLFGLIGVAGTLWYAAGVIAVLGRDGFANAEALRFALYTQRIPSLFLTAQLFAVVTPLLSLALLLGGTRLPPAAIALAVVCGLTTLATTDRTQFFSLLLTSVFMTAHRLGRALTLRRAVLIGAAAGVLLVGSFLVIERWRGASDRGLFLRLPGMTWVPGRGAVGPGESGLLPVIGRGGQRLAVMYAYATGSYSALDRLLESPAPRTDGAHTFFPILRLLQRAGLLDVALPAVIPDYVELYPQPAPGLIALSFNSYTFLYYPLRDFGIGGALVYTILLGLTVGYVYGWARGSRSDSLRLLVYGQVATALTLTVIVNKFNNTAWWYVLVMSTLPWTSRAVGRVAMTAARLRSRDAD